MHAKGEKVMHTRIFIGLFSAFASISVQAQGQSDSIDYPSKPLRIIVGFTPGGGPDLTARQIAQKLGEVWKQQEAA